MQESSFLHHKKPAATYYPRFPQKFYQGFVNADYYTPEYAEYVNPLPFRIHLDASRAVDSMHVHPFVQIWYTRSGEYLHSFRHKDFLLKKGSLVIVPPYFPHAIDTRSDCELVRCEFSNAFVTQFCEENVQQSLFNTIYLDPVLVSVDYINPYYYFSDEVTADIEKIFEDLCHEYSKLDEFSSSLVRSNLVRLLSIVSREYKTDDRDKVHAHYREGLDNALKYINENYAKKIYLSEICRLAMMSEKSFFYLFKQTMGMSFSKYVQYLRILKAKELLISTDRTQCDIADACGFGSITHFHRTFKKFVGMLPGEYRSNPSE